MMMHDGLASVKHSEDLNIDGVIILKFMFKK